MSQPSWAGAAATYVNLGIIIAVAVGLIFVLIGASGAAPIPNPTFFLGIGVIFWLVSLGAFMLSSEKIRQRDFYGARTPTIVFGLVLIALGAATAALLINLSSMFLLLSFGAIISGLLFLMAHSNIQPSYAGGPAPVPQPPRVEPPRPGARGGDTVIVPSSETRLSGIATLSCRIGSDAGGTYSVGSGITRIGRDSANEVYLHDDTVSRSHAQITYDGRDFYAEDLGSKNGTYVDGTIVPRGHKTKLRDGAEIRLGPEPGVSTTFVFQSTRGTRLAGETR